VYEKSWQFYTSEGDLILANTTNYGWARPAVGDAGTGYATALLSTLQEIDTDLAVEHDYASGHEGHHKDVTYNSMTADALASVTKKATVQVYQFVPADKFDNGAFDPLGTASWAGAKSAATGTINWYSVFGVPAAARAVQLTILINDVSNPSLRTNQGIFKIKAKEATQEWSLQAYTTATTLLAGGYSDYTCVSGIVPISAVDGTSYYQIIPSYSGGSVYLYFYVTGYFI
jgi:hypothetical protein